MTRVNYLPAPHYFNLNMACRALQEAFGAHGGVYLVGSALHTRDYRDVDVRCILEDAEFDRLFPGVSSWPGASPSPSYDPLWSIVCSSISLYLSQHSGLPVDFQIQRMTAANAVDGDKPRSAIGIFLASRETSPTETGSEP
jgi:hypothetical protein